MAAPIETYVQIADDSGNSGKKIRTESLVVGLNTVHQHHFIQAAPVIVKGVYYVTTTVSLTAAANNGTTTASYWLQNPLNSPVNLRIRRMEIATSQTSATAMLSTPKISFGRFTHTGNWTGATISITKRKSSDPTAKADVRTASTGTVVTHNNSSTNNTIIWGVYAAPNNLSLGGVANANQFSYWIPTNEDDFVHVLPGEGVVCYQQDSGTTSDSRVAVLNLCWDEYDSTTG